MTEYASHPSYHRDEGRRQISKSSSSSNTSTSKRITDGLPDARILAQSVDKSENHDKIFTSINQEINRRSYSALGDVPSKYGTNEKSHRSFIEGHKISRKSDMRPSDSSYTRKLTSDVNISTKIASQIHATSRTIQELDSQYHIDSQYLNKTLIDNQLKNCEAIRKKNRKPVAKETLHTFLTHLSEMRQFNGSSQKSLSSSLPNYKTVDQMINGFLYSDVNQPPSRDSSHLQSHDLEANYLLLSSILDREKKPFLTKCQSPIPSQNHSSPLLNHVPYSNPKDEYSASASQNVVAPEEFSCRPNSSSWGEEESSNDKSLAVNLSNPIANSVNTVPPSPEKPRYPYSIEMKEGMFIAVKDGPAHEYLKVDIIENFGSGDLRDGGFSWGWSLEWRSSAPSSATKEKSANKDVHRAKRKLDYEKSSSSPSPKKAKSCSEKRDTMSNQEKLCHVSAEAREIKSKSNHIIPQKHLNPVKSNSIRGEKSSVKSATSTYSVPANAKKSPGVGINQKPDKFCRPAASPVEKRKSPICVPTSDVLPHLPKSECLGKNNNVIDDSTMGYISSKKERSAVYSGRKSALDVQPLRVMSFESVKKNILSLKIGRNVRFELVLPALKLLSASKLHKVEEHNRHILRQTDCLWKKFCESEFRDQKRLNGETWKDAYWRARNLRDKKLKNLTASISNGMAKAHPERQAKWVGVGANNPEKRQRKNKVEEAHKTEVHRIEEIPIARSEANGKGNSSSHKPPPAKKRSGSESSSSNSPQSVQKPTKNPVPKAAKKNLMDNEALAPLMSKTKKMMNFVNRRR